MIRKIAVGAALVAALALSQSLAGTGGSTVRSVTLGDFSVSLVEALERTGAPVSEKVQTVRSLVAGRESSPLTEGLAVTLREAAGLNARTIHPDKKVTRGHALVILHIAMLQAASAGFFARAEADPNQGGMEACLASRNHGQCVVCCKHLGTPANLCAKACFVINKPSASEPIP